MALITLTYTLSFIFESSNTAFRSLGIIYIFAGFFVPMIVSSILVSVSHNPTVNQIISGIFYTDPFYPLYSSLIYLAMKGFDMD